MKFKVQMLAFMEGEIREVEVPNEEVTGTLTDLDLIFYYGQNENQPIPNRCGVSVGDVVEIQGKYYACLPEGWGEISPNDLEAYKAIPRRDRSFSKYIRK